MKKGNKLVLGKLAYVYPFLTFPLFSYGPLPSADTVKLTIRQVKRAEQREARRRKRMESSREPGFQVVCNASMYATLSKININRYNNDNVHPSKMNIDKYNSYNAQPFNIDK